MPKPAAGPRKEEAATVSVKARRLSVKFRRLSAAPSLKVLGRDARD